VPKRPPSRRTTRSSSLRTRRREVQPCTTQLIGRRHGVGAYRDPGEPGRQKDQCRP
jgi:hypothetical protein